MSTFTRTLQNVSLIIFFGALFIFYSSYNKNDFHMKMNLRNGTIWKANIDSARPITEVDKLCSMRKSIFWKTIVKENVIFSEDGCLTRDNKTNSIFSYFVDENFAGTTCQKKQVAFSETPMPQVALASFPGSGNTWVRHLIESVSGIATGSVYCGVVRRAFIGECHRNNPHTIVIKTHKLSNMSKERLYDKTVLILRNPFDAILAEFNRQNANKINVPSKESFESEKWKKFAMAKPVKWSEHALYWITTYKRPLHIMFYELMKSNFNEELYKLTTFLGVKVTFNDIWCTKEDQEGRYHRTKPDWLNTSILYTPKAKTLVNLEIQKVSDAIKSVYGHNAPLLTELFSI